MRTDATVASQHAQLLFAHPSTVALAGLARTFRATPRPITLVIERSWLILITATLPLQDHLPTLLGVTVPWVFFAVTLAYVLLRRPYTLGRVGTHPIFLSLYLLLFIAASFEMVHPHADFVDIGRTGEMVFGGVLIAALCRDRGGLKAGVSGFILAGMWLAVPVFLNAYGLVSMSIAQDFETASRIRNEVFSKSWLIINLNTMAAFLAMAAVATLGLALSSISRLPRIIYLCISAMLIVAAFLPLSRSGAINVIISCLLVVLIHMRRKRARSVLGALVLAGLVVLFVPGAVFKRMTFTQDTRHGSSEKQDARAQVYDAAFENAPEFIVAGVGSGNYWNSWAERHGFTRGRIPLGAHNGFLQVWICWGFLGFMALCNVIWQAWRVLAAIPKSDGLSLPLRGLAASWLLLLFSSNVIYAKQFSLGFGMIAAAAISVWPRKNPRLTDSLRLFRTRLVSQR